MGKQIREPRIVTTTSIPVDKISLKTLCDAPPSNLARLGITWNGGKAVGLPQSELMPVGVSAADFVIEDRR